MSEKKTQRGEEMAALRGRAESWVVPRNSPAGGRSSSRPCIQPQHGALVRGHSRSLLFSGSQLRIALCNTLLQRSVTSSTSNH